MHTGPLLETDLDPDPLAQFHAWFAEARAAGMRAPEAMAIATATRGGAPSVRMVLLKEATGAGFSFHTNYGSRKGRELGANPQAALLFHWDPLGRQVRVEGAVERLPEDESAVYFATRPRGGQIAAWASRQSEPLASREELDDEVSTFAARFEGADVPLPPHWGGYRLVAARYEFWQHRDDRLHDRFRYDPDPAGGWRRTRLAP